MLSVYPVPGSPLGSGMIPLCLRRLLPVGPSQRAQQACRGQSTAVCEVTLQGKKDIVVSWCPRWPSGSVALALTMLLLLPPWMSRVSVFCTPHDPTLMGPGGQSGRVGASTSAGLYGLEWVGWQWESEHFSTGTLAMSGGLSFALSLACPVPGSGGGGRGHLVPRCQGRKGHAAGS